MVSRGVSIKTKITITLVLLPLISLLVVGAIALIQNRDSLANQAEVNLERIILEKTKGYNYIFERIQQEAEAAAKYAEMIYRVDAPTVDLHRRILMPWTGEGYGSEEIRAALYKENLRLQRSGQMLEAIVSNNPYLTLGYLGTETGMTVFDNEDVVDVIEKLEAFDVRTRPWYIQAKEAKRTIWTEPYVDANTKKLTVTSATPVYPMYGASESIVGVVGFDVLLETLQNDILGMDIGYDNYAFMINSEGMVLIRPGMEKGDVRWDETYKTDNLLQTDNTAFNHIIAKMISGTESIDSYKTADGDENYLAYAFIPNIRSSVGIVVPRSEIVQPVEESGKLVIVALALTIIIALGMGLILSNQVTRPIEEITLIADKVSRGLTEVEEIPIKRRDEIGALANSFNRMISNLTIVMKELEEKNIDLTESKKQNNIVSDL